MSTFLLIGLYLLFCFLIAGLGKDKNIGFRGAFAISFLLSPLVGLLVVLGSSPKVTRAPGMNQINMRAKLGNEKLDKKDYDGALREFTAILSLTNKAPKSHFIIALIHSVKNNKDRAPSKASM